MTRPKTRYAVGEPAQSVRRALVGVAVAALLNLTGCGTLNVSPLSDAPAVDAAPDDARDDAGCPTPGCADLIAYWTFDGDLVDKVGKRPVRRANVEVVVHADGMALKFDGLNGLASVERNPELPPTEPDSLDNLTSLTFSALINPGGNGRGSFGPILAKGGAGANAAKRWLINGLACQTDPRLCIELTVDRGTAGSDNADAEAVSLDTATKDQWQFVAATFDPEVGIRLYVGREEMDYPPDSLPMRGTDDVSHDDNTSYAIGGWPTPNGNNGVFDGEIDEVRIYRRALSLKDIGDLYDVYAPVLQSQ